MITAAQLRAARGLLDWTRTDLAKAAGVSPETIKNIEHGIYTPQEATTDLIVKAVKTHGVEFTEFEGVRLRRDTLDVLEGEQGFRQFMDDVYAAACDPSARTDGDKQICVSNVDDRLFVEHLGAYADLHVARMNKLKGVKIRVLTSDESYFVAPESDYIEYRWLGAQTPASVPFYVYGDKFAVIFFREKGGPQIVVMSSPLVATAYRDQFFFMWKMSNSKKI